MLRAREGLSMGKGPPARWRGARQTEEGVSEDRAEVGRENLRRLRLGGFCSAGHVRDITLC